MHTDEANQLVLDLDLGFSGFPDEAFQGPLDSKSRSLLTEHQIWEAELTQWIQFIRSDLTMTCPAAVRFAPEISMGLQLVDDSFIAELNTLWRQKGGATDVLAFSAIDENRVVPKGQCVELGDIVVSVTTAQRQARDQNHGLEMELRWLVSHGLLHLFGWDHPDPISLNEMLSFQHRLLSL